MQKRHTINVMLTKSRIIVTCIVIIIVIDFEIVDIKQLLYVAGVSKFDAGQKGVTFSFRNNNFANINGLVDFIKNYPGTAKLRPDHTVVIFGDWVKLETRIKNVRFIA